MKLLHVFKNAVANKWLNETTHIIKMDTLCQPVLCDHGVVLLWPSIGFLLVVIASLASLDRSQMHISLETLHTAWSGVVLGLLWSRKNMVPWSGQYLQPLRAEKHIWNGDSSVIGLSVLMWLEICLYGSRTRPNHWANEMYSSGKLGGNWFPR